MSEHLLYWGMAIAGLTAVSVVTRSFFLMIPRDVQVPSWLDKALRYAPLAALSAVVTPDILLRDGVLLTSWRDARLWGAAAALVYSFWKKDMLGMILVGMGTYLVLLLLAGW